MSHLAASSRFQADVGGLRVDPRGDSRLLAKLIAMILAACIVLVLAVTMATWYLVGDQSTTSPAHADYVIRPVRMSRRLERIIGIGGLLLTVLAAAVLTWASVRHTFDLRWWLVIGPATAAGALVGIAWRVFTAGVIGANIGAGCLLMFGGPLLTFLLACAIAVAIYLLTGRSR
jgi:hypothetical protein